MLQCGIGTQEINRICKSTQANYFGHSICKSAAQHTDDHGILDKMIQKLGRWTFKVFRLYFTTSLKSLYNLNLSFQKGRLLVIPKAISVKY